MAEPQLLYSLRLDASEGLQEGSTATRWSWRASGEDPEPRRRGAAPSKNIVRGKGVVDHQLKLFPGTVRFEATVLSSRGRPVVPAMVAVAEVVLPVLDEVTPANLEQVVNAEPIVVKFDFGGKPNMAVFQGTIGNDAGERAGGIQLVGTSTDGVEFAEMLRVRSDGGFTFSADLSRLAGPQVSLRSKAHKDLIGPLPLSRLSTALGTFRFKDRRTAEKRAAEAEARARRFGRQ